jgi:aryl-alcohol dehydrogenase-like predicted oxidoreductase
LTDGFTIEALDERDFRRTHRFAKLELDEVRASLRGGGRSAAQGAVAFVLSHPAVTGAIVGVRNEREAGELASAAELRLTPDEIAAIASPA